MPDLTRIQLRRGSSSDWTTDNPILAVGEVGVEITSTATKFKIGNGSENWEDLPYYENTDVLETLFVSSASLSTTLTAYVTSAVLSTTLADYSTTVELTTTLAEYVTDSELITTLANYSTTGAIAAIYAPLASPVITGTMTTTNLIVSSTTSLQSVDAEEISALTYTADVAVTTTALDFATEAFKTISINANTIFTASGYAVGRTITVLVTNGATQRNLTFPTNWVFLGTKPTNIAASKKGILTVTSFGTTEAECIAAWAVQL
jgi:hypothetical protein